MRFFFFPILSLLFFPALLKSQTLETAVRYSQLEAGGTARAMGIGGGIGALGADFSVLSTNPAGLATFRRSEFSFTPAFTSIDTESRLQGPNETVASDKLNFGFSHLGLVFPSRPLNPDWTNTAFGFGLNKMASFHQKVSYEGIAEGSITDRWLELAQGVSPNNLGIEAGLAFDAEAIYNPDENDLTLYSSDFFPNEIISRTQNIKRKGSYNELVFSYAGNYKERLMIGATLGIPIVNFEESKTYVESDPEGVNPVFNELTYTERLTSSGAGINLKLGMILRVNQMLRIGAAVHTPTAIGLKDKYNSNLDYSFAIDGTTYAGAAESPESLPGYRVRTPWRAIGSVGLVFDKKGFLVAELEYVDYTNAKFNFSNVNADSGKETEGELNQNIDDNLNAALNIRLGGEFALDKFRFRGGYTIMQSPYAEGFEPTGILSVGAGAWWSESFFMDVAYRRKNTEGQYPIYELAGDVEPIVEQQSIQHQFLMTFGFKF